MMRLDFSSYDPAWPPREPHGNLFLSASLGGPLCWLVIFILVLVLSGCAAIMHGKDRFTTIQGVAEAREKTKQARWTAIAAASASMTPEVRAMAFALGAMADGMDTHRTYDLPGWDSPAEANITNPTMLLGVGLGALLKPSNTTTNTSTSTTTTTPTTITNTPTITSFGGGQ